MSAETSIEIEGILRDGAGGAASASGGWNLVLRLEPWRRVGDAAVSAEELRVEVAMSQRAMREWMDRLGKGAAVRFTAGRLAPRKGDPEVWVAQEVTELRLDHVEDDLREIRARLDAPVIVDDAVLGSLRLDRELHRFEGGRDLASGDEYGVMIEQSGRRDDRARDLADIVRARAVVIDVEARLEVIFEAIAARMLPLYNKTWREGPELDVPGFLAELQLESIDVAVGRTILHVAAGDLFTGHVIEVRMASDGTLEEVLLAG